MHQDRVGDERYQLERELGTGGTATVWLATDLLADRVCAIKLLLRPSGPGAQAHRERLRAEARAMTSLEHRYVVRVWDHGEHGGRDFIVMEYVAGGSLADHLALRGAMPPASAAALIHQVLQALGAAHATGIVHRDVKPANILLRTPTEVALCDFGIARSEGTSAGTATGVALGSVGFMAPEQRIDARQVGPAADLYATACTLFNLVTHQTPVDLYLAPDHSPRWKDVPAPLRSILRRATQADPSERYVTAEEMADAIEAVLPALEGIPAAESMGSRGPHYVPTVVPGADGSTGPPLSLEAGTTGRTVGPTDWRRTGGRPPGRLALWVGVSLVGTITFLGLSVPPVLQDLQARTANTANPAGLVTPEAAVEVVAPSPVVRPDLTGRWVGNLEGRRPMTLVFRGTVDDPFGELTLRLGTHELRSSVVGRWEETTLVLTEPGPHPHVLRIEHDDRRGLLTGDLLGSAEEPPRPFALVWGGPPL